MAPRRNTGGATCPIPEPRPTFKYTNCDCGMLVRLAGNGRPSQGLVEATFKWLVYDGKCPDCSRTHVLHIQLESPP
jgi:hypothetical protein